MERALDNRPGRDSEIYRGRVVPILAPPMRVREASPTNRSTRPCAIVRTPPALRCFPFRGSPNERAEREVLQILWNTQIRREGICKLIFVFQKKLLTDPRCPPGAPTKAYAHGSSLSYPFRRTLLARTKGPESLHLIRECFRTCWSDSARSGTRAFSAIASTNNSQMCLHHRFTSCHEHATENRYRSSSATAGDRTARAAISRGLALPGHVRLRVGPWPWGRSGDHRRAILAVRSIWVGL